MTQDVCGYVSSICIVSATNSQNDTGTHVKSIRTHVRNVGNNVEGVQTLSRALGTLVATTFEISVNNLLQTKQFNKLSKDSFVRS